MPAEKSLTQHCADGTFRARRHRDLLEGPVVPWAKLALLQVKYTATPHPLERRAIAVEFERAVRNLGADEEEVARREAELAELDAIVRGDPPKVDFDDLGPGLDRWDRMLEARQRRRDGMTLAAIARSLGVSRSTVFRMLRDYT